MRMFILFVAVLIFAGCATKSYPMVVPLSEYEAANMTCGDLAAAMAETGDYKYQIDQEATVDMEAVAGVLIDGGLRNLSAHVDALRALDKRRSSIDLASAAKGC